MDAPTLRCVVRLDSVKLDSTYFTDEGYLVDTPIVTSCGIFEYTNPDGSTRRELRLPKHVFDEESLESYEGKPVIITHVAGEVDKNNVDHEIIGTILSEGYRDGDDVRAKIIIHDTDAMRESGLRELSLGYNLDLDETPGTWKGQPYDAIQKNIEINHLALVGNARAGEQARLNIDGTTPALKGEKKTMRIVQKKKKRRRDSGLMGPDELQAAVDAYRDRRDQRLADCGKSLGDEEETLPIEDIVEAIEEQTHDNEPNEPSDKIQIVKDRRDRRDQEGDPEVIEEALGIIAQQDEDIDTLLDVIEALEAKSDFDDSEENTDEEENKDENDDEETEDEEEENSDESESESGAMNADSIDRLVRTRLYLARIGDRLRLDGLEKMKPLEAKKAIIRKINPQMRLDGKGKAYINAAFDLAVEKINSRKDTNYQRRQMFNADGANRNPVNKTAAERARQKMISRQNQNGGNE